MDFRASTTASVLSTLDTKINVIAAQSQLQKQYQQEYDRQLQLTLKEVHDKHKDKSLGGPGSGLNTIGERAGLLRRGTLQMDRENMMDIDELDSRKGRRYAYVLFAPLNLQCYPDWLTFSELRKS